MKYTFFFSFLFLFLFSCESDTPENPSAAKMVIEKDGTSFTITTFTNTLTKEIRLNGEARILSINAQVDEGTLSMYIGNWELQNPPEDGILEKSYDLEESDILAKRYTECVTGSQGELCDDAQVTYFITLGAGDIYSTGFDQANSEGVLTITDNDPANKTVSGSFDFVVESPGINSTIAFKGTFENLVYTIQ